MSVAINLPANRAVLFANLGQALNNGEKFPDLFETSADISPACFVKPLMELATGIREQPDQPLLDHIKKSRIFFPWEVRFICFGLATLRIAEVFARLCDYYVLIGEVTKKLMRWFAALWVVFSFTVGYLLAVFNPVLIVSGSPISGVFVIFFLLLTGWLISPWILRSWIEPNSVLWMTSAKIPFFRSLIVARSVYQYLLNLGLCIQGGFDLDRSLKITAKSEPVAWLRQRYQGVAEDVAGGTQISKAFLLSGVLTETKILAADEGASKVGALWEPGITDVIRQSFVQQLTQVGQLIPMLLLIPLTLCWLTLGFLSW